VTVGITDSDDAVATVLRRSGKPVVVAANKVDDAPGEPAASALWALGLGEPWPVSALHGRGSGDLLDALLAALPQAPAEAARGPPRAGCRSSAAPTWESPACSTSWRARTGSWWTRWRAPPVTRWTS